MLEKIFFCPVKVQNTYSFTKKKVMEYYLMESVIEDTNGMEKSLFEISTPRLE